MPGRLFWEGEAITKPLLELASEHGADLTWLDSRERRVLTLTEAGAPPAPELRIPLSPREVEVLQLIAAGHSNPEIAARLYISPHTVKRHVANLLDKLGATSRTQAAVRARELGIAPESTRGS